MPSVGTGDKGDIYISDGTKLYRLALSGNNGWVLTEDSAQPLGVKWAASTGSGGGAGFPRVVKNGVTVTVQDGFILPGDKQIELEGTGEIDLQGDAEIRLYSNWVV
jgi:hypothetical protein